MYRIAYLEPFNNLYSYNRDGLFYQINTFLTDRITGIRQGLKAFEEADVRWLNSDVDMENFIKSGEYNEYEGILLTAPDRKTLNSIKKLKTDVPFMISGDYNPGKNFNYTGPDYEADVRNVLDLLLNDGIHRIGLVCGWDSERGGEIIRAFQKIIPEKKIKFNNQNAIGFDFNTGKFTIADLNTEETKEYVIRELLKREDIDAYIFFESSPVRGVCYDLVRIHNKKIPEDYKIISMQGNPYFPFDKDFNPLDNKSITYYKLSSINQDYTTLGLKSITTLCSIIEGKLAKNGNTILVPGIFEKHQSISRSIKLDMESNEHFKANLANYVNEHYRENITAKQVARALDLSYTWFLTKFKTVFSCSLTGYVNRIRLEQAAFLLSRSTAGILEISLEVGFKNSATFITQFKKRFKQTPSAYRKKYLHTFSDQ